MDRPYLHHLRGRRILPGRQPLSLSGRPGTSRRFAPFAHNHAIADEGKRRAIPALAPLRHLFDACHRVGILPAVLKPRLRQQLLSTAHIRRAVWPGPDKNVQLTERRRRVGSHHQPGDFRPRVHPPSLLLNMAVPAQKQLPLQHAVGQFTGRHFRQRRDLPRSGGPCLTAQTIAAANGLNQTPLAIDQGHRHAVHFRLYPQVGFIFHPVGHADLIRQLAHAGMGHRMTRIAGGRRQIVILRRRARKALSPLRQAQGELVVNLIAHFAGALSPVVLFPGDNLLMKA